MQKFDIIIQAGQSNSEGCGRGKVENEFVGSPRCFVLTAEKQVETLSDRLKITYADKPFVCGALSEREDNGEKLADFSLSFVREYEKRYLQADRAVLVVRAAVGGTGFQKGYWTKDGILYLKMLEMVDYALSLNPENRLVAFLWHQGEHDAFEHNDPNRFERQLKYMISSVRERYRTPNLRLLQAIS